jgi:type VI protein secretion system component Hcp
MDRSGTRRRTGYRRRLRPGESADQPHVNWIDLNTWSWNVSRGSGAPAFSTVSVTFGVNRALPPLLADLARGTRLPTVTLQAASTGTAPRPIVTIMLSGVTFTRASDSSSGGSPGNSLSMSFRQVDYK